MTPDELREKVARALYGAEYSLEDYPWETLPESEKDFYRNAADAAIRIAVEACAGAADEVAKAERGAEGNSKWADRIAAAIRRIVK